MLTKARVDIESSSVMLANDQLFDPSSHTKLTLLCKQPEDCEIAAMLLLVLRLSAGHCRMLG